MHDAIGVHILYATKDLAEVEAGPVFRESLALSTWLNVTQWTACAVFKDKEEPVVLWIVQSFV